MAAESLPSLEQMTDILDIKSLQNVSSLPLWIAAFLFLLLLALLVWKLLKTPRSKPKEIPIVPKTLGCNERALQALENLDRLGLLEKGQTRKYFFRLSEIVREFLHEGFALDAIDATTEELMILLKTSGSFAPEKTGQIIQLLQTIDLIKFARFVPSGQELQRLKLETRELLKTEPRSTI